MKPSRVWGFSVGAVAVMTMLGGFDYAAKAHDFNAAVLFDPAGNKIPDQQADSASVNWTLLSKEGNENFNGIGVLGDKRTHWCTVTLIDNGGGPLSPTYVLTNGHCINPIPAAAEVVLDRAVSQTRVTFQYFFDSPAALRKSVAVKRVVYAAMTPQDFAILELESTRQQLSDLGLKFSSIRSSPAETGEVVRLVGVPMADIDPRRHALRSSDCVVGETVKLQEGPYQWQGVVRHHCSAVGGSSGAPLVLRSTGQLVGIHNTGVSDTASANAGLKALMATSGAFGIQRFSSQPALRNADCAINRPCEIHEDGTMAVLPTENYAQAVSGIPACFDTQGAFDLNVPGCRLRR